MTCVLCGGGRCIRTGSSRGTGGAVYESYRCPDCSLLFSDPMLPLDADLYQGAPFEGYYADRWEFARALELIGERRRIFEAGCGDGRFHALALRRGKDVTGVDLNASAIEAAQKRCGAGKFYPWTVGRYRAAFPGERFDVFCAFHLIEHLADPLAFARQAAGMLADDGLIVLAVPNPHRQALHYCGRESWDRPPHHLSWWDGASIGRLMALSGFELIATVDEPLTAHSAVETLIRRFPFGLIRGLERAGRSTGISGPAAVTGESAAASFLARGKRALFYLPALALLPLDRARGLTGRNMLAVGRRRV